MLTTFNNPLHHLPNISFHTNRLPHYLPGHKARIHIDAGILSMWIFTGVLPKRVLNNAGCVIAHTKFKIENLKSLVAAYKVFISLTGSIPAFILYKSIITTQVHSHRFSANRAARNQFRRNTHIRLFSNHFSYNFFIIISFLVAGFTALP